MPENDLRIVHGPSNVGNQAWSLSTGERQLGLRSESVVYLQAFAGFGADHDLHFEQHSKLGRLLAAKKFFLRALNHYDIFHFYFATTYFPGYLDLPLLKFLGKKIFFTFQGCDIRPAAKCPPAVIDPIRHRHAPLATQQRRLRKILYYADKTYVLNPDLLGPSPTSSFLPYASARITSLQPQFRPYRRGETLLVFHAPSDPLVKGTAHLTAAVKRLKQEGYKIRLDMVTGVPQPEVMRRAVAAHLVVDQLLVGWYGVFAVEMMALGKPTLCFLKPEWINRVFYKDELPIVNASAESITQQLRHFLKHPEQLVEIAHRGRSFAEKIHHPEAVARRVRADYERVIRGNQP
ncbi:MAG: glycosyltransferase [Candidatus Kerfeldbacteria bacterium]|nr:glycosyltransferase [Candidatus Kerfeldbacteria bacterium]